MNILILSWRGPGHPNAGGAEQVTFEHAKAWYKAGHDVTLFTSNYSAAKDAETLENIHVIRRGDYAFGVKFAAFFWYLTKKHPKFDLVIDEFHGIPFFTPLYIRTRKLAFIHEAAREVWKKNFWPKPYNLIPATVGTIFEPFVFKLLYRKIPFMTVSESTKTDLISYGIPPKNITIIHNGVKLFLPAKTLAKDLRSTAIYLGALSDDKGTPDAIKVFAEIARKDDMWQFWVVGPGTPEYVKKLKRMAEDLGIMGNLKFWGFVSDTKKFELLSRSHILINTSIHEGWGLVNIEANSCGIPVIGYDVKGIRDSVKNKVTGILVPKGDIRNMAEQALKIVRSKEVFGNYQKECRKWASKFSWQKATAESLQLIESL